MVPKVLSDSGLTQASVQSLLHYCEHTGVFTRRVPRGPFPPGSVCGSVDGGGYIHIRLGKHRIKAHHLAWLYVYGTYPSDQLDHINGVKTDNRIANLREAPQELNTQNTKLYKNSTSGVRGVRLHVGSGKWQARIRTGGVLKHLGLFDSIDGAAAAYKSARAMFHKLQPIARD